ncbi:unnamed protein product [Prunus armeniaca]|uniref:RRM domain-containing protein n=1 Tax=Prunus armeniaca TaxID=36596 RepID=A0A6J5XW67_PRUAR|nr:unnamed protein product [Prunus armeniaca]
MRTRNADSPKSVAGKKTPPARKTAAKAQPAASQLDLEAAAPKTVETKRVSAADRAKQVKKTETTPPTASNSQKSSVEDVVNNSEEAEASAGTAKVTPAAKVGVVNKLVAKKSPGKANAPASAKSVSSHTRKSGGSVKAKVDALNKEKVADLKDVEFTKKNPISENDGKFEKEESHVEFEVCTVENVGEPSRKEESAVGGQEPAVENVEQPTNKQSAKEVEPDPNENEEDPIEEEDPVEEEDPFEEEDPVEEVDPIKEDDPVEAEKSVVGEVVKSSENEPYSDVKEGVAVKGDQEEPMDNGDEEETRVEAANKVENVKEGLQGEDIEGVKDLYDGDEQMDEYGEKVDLGEHGEEELPEDDAEDPAEETETLEDKQLTAIANERKMKKEREIFLGGLDRDAVEEDVRRVFERIGGIVEVRLHKNTSTNKNKGYAFVEFENKELARRALSEMKNPVIRGKRCGTAPSEDNDTLFLGNICNTWTKEAIKQKLKDYGVEGVENINLVPDVQHDGLSRGFAFVEFSCHGDAMLAYKRLQQPDAIFGHLERTAKVAFAEPLREPDPEIMSQVKSVFVDGLPPHWDEDQVREQFKCYGEILRIVLARNMSTAKRKDFGFVDFSTHESAVACVDGINNIELADGNSKIKVKARLSNPLPKTQAVKGGMAGGFRIGGDGGGGSGGGSGIFPRFGRGFGRGGHHFNRANFQRDRHFYHGGQGQTGRMGFPNEYDFDYPYDEFHGRGGRRGPFMGGHYPSAGGSSSRPYIDGPWNGAPDRGYGMHIPPRRLPYSPEGHFGRLPMGGHFDRPPMGGHFDRPPMGGHFDEPYFYDDNTQGIKRPFHMRDYDYDYLEPSRHRPRLDYTDPTASFRGNHYSDTYGAGSSLYSHDYYGPEVAMDLHAGCNLSKMGKWIARLEKIYSSYPRNGQLDELCYGSFEAKMLL